VSEIPWLPEFVERTAEETQEAYLDRLYVLFRDELMTYVPPAFAPKIIAFSAAVTDGRCETFHHCTTTEPLRNRPRVFDPHRAKRIRWIRPMIEAAADPSRTVSWSARAHGEMRFKIALPDFRYLVVFTESSNVMFLVSAFYVVDPNYRRQIAREKRRAELPL